MSRRCMVTGKMQMTGNTVSHAQNKTRRIFRPSVKDQSFYSEILGKGVRVRVSANGVRSIEHKGGLDIWLTGTAATKLPQEMRRVKKRIEKVLAAKGKTAPKLPSRLKKPMKKANVSARLAKKNAAKKKAA